ncbi:hypothetical protein JTE90_024101 [Oedothorax gibbosus]|uniref:Uncharacterized protein n=1 Tax=Oedothorax gibbosus TaxID=931172 RepID=A0AAV6UQW5_9ARAC|nr:hypothetical protein JTE90_024101 [Oedothorax gibbosus]
MNQPKVWFPDLLKSSAKSKKKFITNFGNYDHESIRKLCLEILNKTEKIAESGDVDGFKSLNWFVEHISGAVQERNFCDYFIYANNDSVTRKNILVLICKHSHGDILNCLFSEEFKLLWNFLVKLQIVSLTSTDEEQHNAIYYAIRSNNVQLLNILIHKWPNDYFCNNAEELDELLSLAYEELKLKNVLLTDETQAFVENVLINLRFFHNNSNSKPLLSSKLIQSRIEILIASIEKLQTFCSDSMDERFLYLVKFIARNVYVLKRQLKCTYSKLPWEEIEFCLIAFVFSHTTDEDINLIYSSVLNKAKILTYLDHFSRCLCKELNCITNLETKKLSIYPKMKRDELIKNIINISPEFAPLYADYMVIRDIHSLETVKKYTKLSLSANTNDKEGQLVIIRALQVCGEHFKNTVESPKLSSSTCELLLSLLPRDTRQIIIDLRNSLSHSNSLGRRLEIEENADLDFFENIKNDVGKINAAITEILLKRKISEIKLFLKKIVDSENSDEIKENMAILCDLKLQSILSKESSLSLSNEIEEIEKLVTEINNEMNDKTYYEAQLLDKIFHIINVEKKKFEKVQTSYMSGMLVQNFTTYKNDKSLQVVVEMLLLDIMSILEDSNKNLTDNLLFLDENSPMLVGRNLRNHLAHGNALCDILQNKPSVSIALNAKKIIAENIAQQKKKLVN